MISHMRMLPVSGAAVAALALGAPVSVSWGQEDFSALKVLIEINATDGDAGFHVLLDGDPWKEVRIDDPDGKKIFDEKAKGNLRVQGLTENFFESAEPPCAGNGDEEPVPLGEFLERFPAGEYFFTGKLIEGGRLEGEATLTYDLPAAPDITVFDGAEDVEPEDAVIGWSGGDDLGECHDQDLIVDGIIPDPAEVVVVGWEVVVEPDDDEAVDPLRVFSVQLPAGQTSVTVPPEFLNSYADDGVTEFKFEVGAKEASGNQTFSEGTFEIIEDNGLEE